MKKGRKSDRQKSGDNWRQEIQEITSGASGGFLFGIPLIYTMEVWFIGSYARPPMLLIILAITFVIIFFLNRIEGFRTKESETLPGAIAESIETLAIGLVCATLMLVILNRINLQTSLIETSQSSIYAPFSPVP